MILVFIVMNSLPDGGDSNYWSCLQPSLSWWHRWIPGVEVWTISVFWGRRASVVQTWPAGRCKWEMWFPNRGPQAEVLRIIVSTLLTISRMVHFQPAGLSILIRNVGDHLQTWFWSLGSRWCEVVGKYCVEHWTQLTAPWGVSVFSVGVMELCLLRAGQANHYMGVELLCHIVMYTLGLEEKIVLQYFCGKDTRSLWTTCRRGKNTGRKIQKA